MTHVLAGSYLLFSLLLSMLLSVGQAQQQPLPPVTLLTQAIAACDRGDYQQAMQLLHQALASYRVMGDRRGESAVLDNLGVLHRRLRQYSTALTYYQQALAIYSTLADYRHIGSTLANLGEVYNRLNQPTRALASYQQALTLQERVLGQEHPDLLPTLEQSAALLQKLQRQAEADALHEWARHIRRKNSLEPSAQ
jgi:tetratricopeptide (TPR) repeat protein